MAKSGDRDQFVSRGGVKLAAALDGFVVAVADLVCADFGSHVGGFVDCLLQRRAARVHAVEPGQGVLDSTLRADPRVVVHERCNALDFDLPERCDLITIDVGWTPQRLVLSAARRGLAPNGRVITLVKPHYEAPKRWLRGGVLTEARRDEVLATVREDVCTLRWTILGEIESPIRGHGGNVEYLWLLKPADR